MRVTRFCFLLIIFNIILLKSFSQSNNICVNILGDINEPLELKGIVLITNNDTSCYITNNNEFSVFLKTNMKYVMYFIINKGDIRRISLDSTKLIYHGKYYLSKIRIINRISNMNYTNISYSFQNYTKYAAVPSEKIKYRWFKKKFKNCKIEL